MMQTVKKIIPTAESQPILPLTKFEKQEANDEYVESFAETLRNQIFIKQRKMKVKNHYRRRRRIRCFFSW